MIITTFTIAYTSHDPVKVATNLWEVPNTSWSHNVFSSGGQCDALFSKLKKKVNDGELTALAYYRTDINLDSETITTALLATVVKPMNNVILYNHQPDLAKKKPATYQFLDALSELESNWQHIADVLENA